MADSHGDPEAIDNGALYLKDKGCTALYHLGDICDATCLKSADSCVAQVRNHGIVAVKGNNDHTLAIDARGRSDGGIRPDNRQPSWKIFPFAFPSAARNWSTRAPLCGNWACRP